MLSPTRSKSSGLAGRVRSRSSSRRNGSNASEPLPYFPRTTLTPEEQQQLFDNPMPECIDGGTWPTLATPTLTHSRSGSHLPTASAWDGRVSAGPSIAMSSMSSMPSLKQSPPQKKAPGLKATIKRVFGSKRQRTAVSEGRKEFHLSDPGALMSPEHSPKQFVSTLPPLHPRASMQRNPLGSHAVSQSDVRDFGDSVTDEPLHNLKRRNTVPSITFTEHEASDGVLHSADSADDVSEPTTRNNSCFSARYKRQSKSADALACKLLSDPQDPIDRLDRDTDDAFWMRSSILLNPLPQSTPHSSEALTKATTRNDIEHVPSLEHIIQPVQSFDFGLDGVTNDVPEMEDRINTLEVKMYDFEYAIAKLQGSELPKLPLPMKQMKRKNIQEVYAKPSLRSLSTVTSGNERTPITPADSPIMSATLKEPFTPDRSSKATTIRPLTRTRSAPRGSLRLTADQFDTLLALIQDEKDARQHMEMQIIDLQREIELLQVPVYATINYPTPTAESTGVSSSQKKLHRSPPFRFENPPVRETSRFSMTESETESFDDSKEEFQTPRQYRFDFEVSGNNALMGAV